MSSLAISTENVAGSVVVTMVGSADMTHEGVLEQHVNRLSASKPHLVILNLAALTFLASLAVGQLVMLARTIKSAGGMVRIAAPSPEVTAVLVRCKLTDTLPIFANVEAAQA